MTGSRKRPPGSHLLRGRARYGGGRNNGEDGGSESVKLEVT